MATLQKFDTLAGYIELRRWLNSLAERNRTSEWSDAVRWYIENDLFYLASEVLSDGRTINTETGELLYFNQFYVDWCRSIEWQVEHGGGFDGSARGSGKSTLRTKACNIQRMIKYPDSTGCIFSFQKNKAKKHFRGIKEELEHNIVLRTVCDDVLYWDPKTAAKNGETAWSLADGLRVKHQMQRKDYSLEMNAFMDGTPVGGRYDWIDFDDIEDMRAVGTQENLDKLHSTYDTTILLLTPVAIKHPVEMFTNTWYSDAGLAKRRHDDLIKIDERLVRKVPGEDTATPGEGPLGGTALYPFTTKRLFFFWDKIQDKREYAVQICCSFQLGEHRTFRDEWLIRYPGHPEEWGKGKNIYVCIDPSRGVRDPTAIWVWALGNDRKAAWVDASLKKLDPALPEFYEEIFRICAKWAGIGRRLVEVRVENFGQSTFASQIAKEFATNGYAWKVVPCADNLRTHKFSTGKRDREFERWAGPAAKGDIVIPERVTKGGCGLVRADEKGKRFDVVGYFLDYEWTNFPHLLSDNLLDAGSLLWEPDDKMGGPLQYPALSYNRGVKQRRGASAMSAG